ncbi:protein rolling stone-like [Watersipora subatra]|uniref:protein rolling stone-like n=1 Tax=Watersipora subatra TaxID=2589382 RepID=UPI00355BEAEB
MKFQISPYGDTIRDLKPFNLTMFHISGCQISWKTLLLFRTCATVFHWLILMVRLREPERLPAFCYLTNIVYLICTLYYTIAVYSTFYELVIEKKVPIYNKVFQNPHIFRMDKLCYEERSPASKGLLRYIQWVMHSIALNMGILVSVMYFLLIYDPSKETLGLTNVSRHILNSLCILTEFSLNMISVKFAQISYSLVIAAVYAVYTYLFWYIVEPPENYIYKIVDWGEPVKTGVLIVLLMCALSVLHLLLVGISRIKLKYMHILPLNESSHTVLV